MARPNLIIQFQVQPLCTWVIKTEKKIKSMKAHALLKRCSLRSSFVYLLRKKSKRSELFVPEDLVWLTSFFKIIFRVETFDQNVIYMNGNSNHRDWSQGLFRPSNQALVLSFWQYNFFALHILMEELASILAIWFSSCMSTLTDTVLNLELVSAQQFIRMCHIKYNCVKRFKIKLYVNNIFWIITISLQILY